MYQDKDIGDVQFQFGNVMIVKTQNNYSQEKKLLNLQLSYQTEKILNYIDRGLIKSRSNAKSAAE